MQTETAENCSNQNEPKMLNITSLPESNKNTTSISAQLNNICRQKYVRMLKTDIKSKLTHYWSL